MKVILSFILVFFVCVVNSQNNELFTLLSANETGIEFNNKIKDSKEQNILIYANFYGGAGVGIGDFNNDGLQDVYFAGNLVEDKLYLNLGDFKFKDITKVSGIINDGSWSTGVTVADVNNDGLLDIYISNELYDEKPILRKNKLYINQGNAKFKEMAESYGVANSERTRHATFFDYNKDGYLDLFILNQPPNPGSYSSYFGTKLLQNRYSSRLYKNVNGKHFIDVTLEAGLLQAGFPNAVSASDLNNDGWTDLYVANDFYAPDFMYINNKDGSFTDMSKSALKHMSYYSMGLDVSDVNNDGLLDIFVVDMVAEDNFRLKSNMSGMNPASFWKVVDNGGHYQYMFNNFHLNNGNNTFSDIAQLTNMAATDWSWSTLLADFDNDGNKDIYITNGLLRDIRNTDASKAVGNFVMDSADKWVKDNPNGGEVTLFDILDLDETLSLLPSVPLSNFMFNNKGGYEFENVATVWGIDQKSFSNGAAYADFDNDGDLDLIVNNINREAFIYKNNSKNNFIRLKLSSKKNNPLFGTKIYVTNNDKKQFIETTNVRGIYSTSEQTVHFGVGNKTIIDEIKVIWPNSSQTVIKNITSNQVLNLVMEKGILSKKIKSAKTNTLFTDITEEKKIDYTHIENDLDDYKYQVLLPHKMSQFGPALSIADINNDGLEDVFVGAASGYTPQIFIQTSNGDFKPRKNEVFELDKITEDVDAVFFDIDNDGDQDLYVVSGGNEFEKDDINYKDRLYINDGFGNFSKSKNALKSTNFSGSIVITTDFDNDGDLDVFVGGRHTPRQYPLPTNSKLFENIDGKLKDVTKNKAIDLINLGMVTDAVWTDFDKDNDMDLIVVGEWMTITIIENNNGVFSKINIPSLEKTSGWWFSIEQGDFDNDGDIDFIAGNLGLNYKYKTSEESPFDVYYKDFDGNGNDDIVLGYYNYGKHYPLRGFSCSAQQIPSLKSNIKAYDIFASMEIDEVYDKTKLTEAIHYKTQTFATSFIENLGNNDFRVTKLPIEAQFSSVNDILIKDFNKDGNLDVLLVGNLYVSEIETPRNDASIGLVLLGDGENNFTPMSNQKSGIVVRGDAKKVKYIENNNQKLLLVTNNNDLLQVFKLNE